MRFTRVHERYGDLDNRTVYLWNRGEPGKFAIHLKGNSIVSRSRVTSFSATQDNYSNSRAGRHRGNCYFSLFPRDIVLSLRQDVTRFRFPQYI